MGKIFDMDSPVMRVLTKIADLMILNMLTLLAFLPTVLIWQIPAFSNSFAGILVGLLPAIFLIGPALTGMHYVLLKMARNEDSYVIKGFFKSFKENYRQAAVLGIIVILVAVLMALDLLIMRGTGAPFLIIAAMALFLYMVSMYVFPLEARFVNTIPTTLKNALLMAILGLPRTICMVLVTLIPFLLLYFVGYSIIPIVFLFGLSGPGYLCALLYSGLFKRFEPEPEPEKTDEEDLISAIQALDDDEVVASLKEGVGEQEEETATEE